MRRGLTWMAALALVAGGLAGCGDDGDDGDGASTTSAGASNEALIAEIDAFCTGVDEFQSLVRDNAETLEDEAIQSRIADMAADLARTELELEAQVSRLVPGEIARYERCAETFTPSGG